MRGVSFNQSGSLSFDDVLAIYGAMNKNQKVFRGIENSVSK